MRTYPTSGARFCFQNGFVSRFETREWRLDTDWVNKRDARRLIMREHRSSLTIMGFRVKRNSRVKMVNYENLSNYRLDRLCRPVYKYINEPVAVEQ